jgi:hypothetical protein
MMAVSLAVTFVLQEMDANSTRRVWGALDSFRSQFERPSENKCNRETQDHKQDYRARDCIGEMQCRNYRRCDLHHEPSNNRISDGNFVNIAPLQLCEEVLRVHCARLDEALVTAGLYLDALDLKSACNLNYRSEGAPAFL